jgi:diaminohydroxyphosphoribosylaminopyrimidine deaminase/5-amino-6-(5-phosphoribosylamino)uracil reductase
MNKWSQEDERFMQRALAIARRAVGRVEPNPMVGCVLVKRGRKVGEGHHRDFGGPHAEVNAITSAGNAAKGATAYVTLEPCCHHGKTPPCTEALIRSGVVSVIAAMKDPNPLVAGKGLRRLRAAGIITRVGLLEREAESLTAPFVTCQTRKRPYIILKWAQSLDGKIATRTGDSQWITSLASRRESHRLRARVDAIVVGVETVLADDPELTARHARRRRIATRVVLDSQLRTPPSARLVCTANVTPTLIVTSPSGLKRKSRAAALEAAGCELIAVKSSRSGISLPALARELHRRSMTNVMVEGGGRVLGSFFDSGLGDEAIIFVAPRLIGGAEAPGPLDGLGPKNMTDLAAVEVMSVRRLGVDLCYNVRFHR